jgi:hypothetical protein
VYLYLISCESQHTTISMMNHNNFLRIEILLANNHGTESFRSASAGIANNLHTSTHRLSDNLTCASPSCKPSAAAGSIRASMQVITITLRAGGNWRCPLLKEAAYFALACSNSLATVIVEVRESMKLQMWKEVVRVIGLIADGNHGITPFDRR